jgi:hypothetical protein
MKYFDIFIIVIFIVKIVFIILAISDKIIKRKKPLNKKLSEKLEFWKDRVEFIFIALMSVVLIYIFNPRSNRLSMITGETKLLLFLFGIVLLITAKWDLFFKESKTLKSIKNIIK